MKKKRDYRFISESVLLEERGLPFIKVLIIISVTILIFLFILWSNTYEIDEELVYRGVVDLTGEDLVFMGQVPADQVLQVSVGQEMFIMIRGYGDGEEVAGVLTHIEDNPRMSTSGSIYYEVTIVPRNQNMWTQGLPLKGMVCQVRTVIKTKTLLNYLLGNLYDTGRELFDQ